MSKIVQHLGRISRISSWVIVTALLSALVLVPAVVMAQSLPSADFKVILTFNGNDGSEAEASMIMDEAGNLYGTTSSGGDLSCPSNPGDGCGVVFKIDPNGMKTVLHKFKGEDGTDPESTPLLDAAGNLYGAATQGGSSNQGVVFKLAPNKQYTVLYAFKGGTDGGQPWKGSLLLDTAGNVYGTTYGGGDPTCQCGVVYKVTPSGGETVLYSFTGGRTDTPPLA